MGFLKRKDIDNQAGFSLVEIMVAAGLIGILSTAIVSLTKTVQKSSRSGAQKTELGFLERELIDVLKDPIACRKTFVGQAQGDVVNQVCTSRDGVAGACNPYITTGDTIGDTVNFIKADSRFTVNQMMLVNEPGSEVLIGDPYASIPGGADDRQRARLFFEVSLSKGGAGADAASESSKTLGGSSSRIRFPIIVEYDTGAGDTIISCYGDMQEFSRAVCNGLGGVIENGFCKRIRVLNTVGNPITAEIVGDVAVTEKANIYFDYNDTTAASENDLFVEGTMHLGGPDIRDDRSLDVAQEGLTTASNMLVVTSEADLANAGNEVGSAYFENGVGVGRPPLEDGAGDPLRSLLVNRSLVIGDDGDGLTNPGSVLTDQGQVIVGNSLGVNVIPPAADGDASIFDSVSVGGIEDAGGALAIGHEEGDTNGAGNLVLSRSLGVGDEPYNDPGSARIATSLTIGNGVAEANSSGATLPTQVSIRVRGHIDIPSLKGKDTGGLVDLSANDTFVVSADWVARKIADSFSVTETDMTDTYNDILQEDPVAAGFIVLCNRTRHENASLRESDPSVFTTPPTVIEEIGSPTLSGGEYVCTLSPKYCSTDDQCDTVYAGSYASGTGNIDSNGNVESLNHSVFSDTDIEAYQGIDTAEICVGGVLAAGAENTSNGTAANPCITQWEDLQVGVGGTCESKSVNQECSKGFVVTHLSFDSKNLTNVYDYDGTWGSHGMYSQNSGAWSNTPSANRFNPKGRTLQGASGTGGSKTCCKLRVYHINDIALGSGGASSPGSATPPAITDPPPPVPPFIDPDLNCGGYNPKTGTYYICP